MIIELFYGLENSTHWLLSFGFSVMKFFLTYWRIMGLLKQKKQLKNKAL